MKIRFHFWIELSLSKPKSKIAQSVINVVLKANNRSNNQTRYTPDSQKYFGST